jgi:ParB family chromosome partitioning protein
MKGNQTIGELVYIPIDNLYPHPDNPRKDLGDLTELAESIKAKGVMQNLTVVPKPEGEGNYTVIIGHRRTAAAKLAGLEKLPCIITEMTPQEQFDTMLVENINRENLTPMEQAQGFQIMFEDWGYDEKKISEKTGFSETTVRHRLNMAKLSKKAVETYERDNGFQLSLSDYYALEKVPTVKERNEILKSANSPRDIQRRAAQAEMNDRRNKAEQKIIKLLKNVRPDIEPFPQNANRWDGSWENIKDISLDKSVPDKIAIGKAKKDDKLYYYRNYSEIDVYRKLPKKEKVESDFDRERKERDKRKKQLGAILKTMTTRRRDFVLAIIDGKIDAVDKKETEAVKEKVWGVLIKKSAYISKNAIATFIVGKDLYNATQEERDAAYEKAEKWSMLHQMLAVMCAELKETKTTEWDGTYSKTNADILKLGYAVLKCYGWTFEEDEESVLDGTHELYTKKKE